MKMRQIILIILKLIVFMICAAFILVAPRVCVGRIKLVMDEEAFIRPFEPYISSDQSTEEQKIELPGEVRLDVGLIEQLTAPSLYNGCEVTSLAMLLNYYGIEATKSELAEKIKTVPLSYDDGLSGNPNDGFVGSVSGASKGLGVYHAPVYDLAQHYTNEAQDITGCDFETLLSAVGGGHPVWIITTSSYGAVNDIQVWNTPSGEVEITFSMHSVVVTGYDENFIYVNDPYGYKDNAVEREVFIEGWTQMGSQAIYIDL